MKINMCFFGGGRSELLCIWKKTLHQLMKKRQIIVKLMESLIAFLYPKITKSANMQIFK